MMVPLGFRQSGNSSGELVGVGDGFKVGVGVIVGVSSDGIPVKPGELGVGVGVVDGVSMAVGSDGITVKPGELGVGVGSDIVRVGVDAGVFIVTVYVLAARFTESVSNA